MMTLEKAEGLTAEGLREIRDRPLEESYETHDVGHDLLIARLEAHDFHVEDHGDDARHADEIYWGDGPDLAIYDDEQGELLAYIEIKCKEKDEWFGRCNLRHYNEYVNFSNEVQVPVFIWFALVEQGSSVIHREAFVEVEDTDQIDGEVWNVTAEEVVFYEEDAYEIDDELMGVDGDDVVGVRNDQVIVAGIPGVHGNDVIELNDDHFRSWPHFLHRVDTND